MAGYPFGWAPLCVRELIAIACQEFGCEVYTAKTQVKGEFGMVYPRFLERNVNGRSLHAPLPNWGDDDILLMADTTRSICTRLELPLARFGIKFDEQSGATYIECDHDPASKS